MPISLNKAAYSFMGFHLSDLVYQDHPPQIAICLVQQKPSEGLIKTILTRYMRTEVECIPVAPSGRGGLPLVVCKSPAPS